MNWKVRLLRMASGKGLNRFLRVWTSCVTRSRTFVSSCVRICVSCVCVCACIAHSRRNRSKNANKTARNGDRLSFFFPPRALCSSPHSLLFSAEWPRTSSFCIPLSRSGSHDFAGPSVSFASSARLRLCMYKFLVFKIQHLVFFFANLESKIIGCIVFDFGPLKRRRPLERASSRKLAATSSGETIESSSSWVWMCVCLCFLYQRIGGKVKTKEEAIINNCTRKGQQQQKS